MASFFARGIDVINNPSVSTNSGSGQDGAGRMTLLGGSQQFPDDAIVEFITQNETAAGELDGGSSFIGIRVYADAAAYQTGVVQYNYVPQNPGQSANIQSDVSGLGDTYVRFNANVLVPKTAAGAPDPTAPTFNNILVAPGSNAGDNFGLLVLDRNTDQDFNGNGVIDSGTLENGNGKFDVGNTVPCFTPGTFIATPNGEVAVELLREGDRIITRDNGIQEISWVGTKVLSGAELVAKPQMQPVLIRAGALGDGSPEHDLLVSPNHRILISNSSSTLLFGEQEVLAAAQHLVNGKGILRITANRMSYIHFMFTKHQVVLSEGAWTESFQPGTQSLEGIGQAQRAEIMALFPELNDAEGLHAYCSSRKSLKRHEARLLQN